MKPHPSPSTGVGRSPRSSRTGHAISALATALLASALSACQDLSAAPTNRAIYVRTEVVRPRDRQTTVTLTGEVRSRFSAELSFRVSGRVLARQVDVGAHVEAGDMLARLDPAEQQADLDAAVAAEAAARSQLRVASATFERQKTLIAQGFTTRSAFDQAQEGLRSAEAVLDAAKAQVGQAQDALSYSELKAGAAGVVTARNLEVGQVVQAGQAVFTLAHDGERDAVFDVDESIFSRDIDGDQVTLALVSNPDVTAAGHVREVAPAVDAKSSTVRVKVAIENSPAALALGSAVAGTAKSHPSAQIALPWTALTASGSQPAVWIVDPATNTVLVRPVAVGGFEAGTVVVRSGLDIGERIVVDGGKLLSRGQAVTYDTGESQ